MTTSIMKKTGNGICLISAMILALAIGLFFMKIHPAVVVSGSMEPVIHTGSLIFIDTKDKRIQEGDIIAFRSGSGFVAHRAVRKNQEGWVTKGDSNQSPDLHVVKESELEGTVKFWIPYIGYAIGGIRSVSSYFLASVIKLNTVSIGENDSAIEEVWLPPASMTAGKDYEKGVRILNKDSVPCFVRVFAETATPGMRNAVDIDYNSSDWEKKSDGYYYYKSVLDAGSKTAYLFTNIHAKEDVSEFELIVYEETVQSEGYADSAEAFAEITGKKVAQ